MLQEKVKALSNEMIHDLETLVSYPSVFSEDAKPFGQANIDCLHAALEIGKHYGFKTGNLDNYCGYIEMGQGEEIIGVLAHLDVVPVSKTWATDPFKLTLKDGKYYGRGTSDDKGAVVATLAAMRLLKELEPTFKKRVRLLLGCNEETGSRGIAHYVEKEGYVNCGFTPDGDFPLVYGEKGGMHAIFTGTSEKILDIKGGTVFNAVANNCVVTLKENVINTSKLDAFFKENKIDYTFKNNVLNVKGVAAHASLPHLGVNAISYAMEGLYHADINDDIVTKYHELIATDYHGKHLGIDFKDEYGDLTFNIGLAFKEDEKLIFTIDIRYPVTMKAEQVSKPLVDNSKGMIQFEGATNPLFFPPDHPMIKALMKAYVDVTGDKQSQPMVIGGGTYAKEMHNIVAFGCDDGKNNYHIHDDNEFVTMDSLITQASCYYQAILNLQEI